MLTVRNFRERSWLSSAKKSTETLSHFDVCAHIIEVLPDRFVIWYCVPPIILDQIWLFLYKIPIFDPKFIFLIPNINPFIPGP